MVATVIIIILLLIVVFAAISSIKVVNTGYVYVLERFGQFSKILEPGWHLVIPFADFVRKKISTKQQILDIPPQYVITKDNVKIEIDNVIFYKVLNAKDAVYNIEDFKSGIVYSTITNMRNIVGNMSLDEVLSGRDKINLELLTIIDSITDAYGIKILSVEIKNIIPPAEIQDAMEKQMKAERDKRATILQAEGLKESQLLEAEGKARAIEEVSKAEAAAIERINTSIIESGTNEVVIALKQVEALKEMAANPANKLILPNEAVSSLGSIAAIADILKENKENK
ncbi:SPFH/Band 7/PHB domain protein [Clostridium perfringens]|nr:SPFH/Band 7/PHB domain protein [Clostridium perfringens]